MDERNNLRSSSVVPIGESRIDYFKLACPCCGDLHLEPDFWNLADKLLMELGNDKVKVGYLCWEEARLRNAVEINNGKSKPSRGRPKRLRLSGMWEMIYRGNAFILDCPIDQVIPVAEKLGLFCTTHEIGTVVFLPT